MSGLPGRLLAVSSEFFGSTPPPPNSDRQISNGIWTPAKPSFVNAKFTAVSASTADRIRGSCGRLVGMSLLRNCSQPLDLFDSAQTGAILGKSGFPPANTRPV